MGNRPRRIGNTEWQKQRECLGRPGTMQSPDRQDVVIRDATADDMPALVAIRDKPTTHRDRVRDADGKAMRYLVAEDNGEVVAFGCLVLEQPARWPKMAHVPQLVDLHVRQDRRNEGIGTTLVRAMEAMARRAGYAEMHLGVDPRDNRRAAELYRRLGYEAMDNEPVEEPWEFVDSDGQRHVGVELLVYMRRSLS